MLEAILMLVAILLILLTLLQGGKSSGLSGAFSGSGDINLFQNAKERGPEKIISRVTLILGALFFILVIVIKVSSI
ncbi:MAG: preprotein translocase subunit SecG [Erysipelotrichaceae bacterium]